MPKKASTKKASTKKASTKKATKKEVVEEEVAKKEDVNKSLDLTILIGLIKEKSLQNIIFKTLFENKVFKSIFLNINSTKYSDQEKQFIKNNKNGAIIIKKLRLFLILENEFNDLDNVKIESSDEFEHKNIKRVLKKYIYLLF